MRRFYKEARASAGEGGFAVLLDGKPVKTPAGHPLVLPTHELASTIAAEWQAQAETIQPASMPMMQFAATALDHMGPKRRETIERLIAYLENELLCHRAPHPVALQARQRELWQPPLDWLKQRYDIVLEATESLSAVRQPEMARTRLTQVLEALDAFQLIGVQTAILASGSLVLGLALYEGAMDADAVFAAAELESGHQIEVWGDDPELEARRAGIAAELKNTALWFALIKSAS